MGNGRFEVCFVYVRIGFEKLYFCYVVFGGGNFIVVVLNRRMNFFFVCLK